MSSSRGTAGLGQDPGAQPQRTALAWQRSVLACSLGGLLLAFAAERQGHPAIAAAAAVLAAAVVVTMIIRLRHWRHSEAGSTLHLLAAGVAGLGALGLTASILGVLG